MSAVDTVRVAAAVLMNAQGHVLISRRPAQAHQGGLWEFPGGKIEPGETVFAALCRELEEELGITVQTGRPLIRIPYRYPDKAVLLDVWRVEGYSGEPQGCEGQPLQWVAPERLSEFSFPAANAPIISAARLPERYLITPEPDADFLPRLEQALAGGIQLLQLRAKTLATDDYIALAREVCARAHRHGAQVLLNAEPAWVAPTGADGVHLTSARLRGLATRPLPPSLWVAASCHDAAELAQATRLGVDFAVLGPVQATASHPQALPLEWDRFQALAEAVALPVYALGGLAEADLTRAWQAGAQGIAAIRGLWSAVL